MTAVVTEIGDHRGKIQLKLAIRDSDLKALRSKVGGTSAALATMTASAPEHWLSFASSHGERIRDRLGATTIAVDGTEMQAEFDNSESLHNAEPTLRSLLRLPAASVAIPSGKGGVIIGRGGSAIKESQQTPGIEVFEFDNASSTVLAIGDSTAITSVLAKVANAVGAATGRMRVGSPSDNGKIIGKGGAIINDLKARSGCTEARSEGRDSVDWTLAGPSAATVEEFIRLVQAMVPAATGAVTSQTHAVVTDLNSGQEVGDLLRHVWADAGELRIEIQVSSDAASVTHPTTRDGHRHEVVKHTGLRTACSSMAVGHLEVFAADAAGRLRHRWFWPDDGWSDWYDFEVPDGCAVVAVAAGSHDDGHQEVFIGGADGSLFHRWNWLTDDGGSTWSEWHQLG